MNRHSAPIIAAFMLLLPVLYVGSYLALVVPDGFVRNDPFVDPVEHYRIGGQWGSRVFWPLEQIDREMRPGTWFAPLPPSADPFG
jgi:hypothetical protein